MPGRSLLEAEWLRLTRETLPALAAGHGWPVRTDHCFQRILLDHAVGGRWYDHVAGRPAYRHLDEVRLAAAVTLGMAVAAGEVDLAVLNRRSLAWRGKRSPRHDAVGLGDGSAPAANGLRHLAPARE